MRSKKMENRVRFSLPTKYWKKRKECVKYFFSIIYIGHRIGQVGGLRVVYEIEIHS